MRLKIKLITSLAAVILVILSHGSMTAHLEAAIDPSRDESLEKPATLAAPRGFSS